MKIEFSNVEFNRIKDKGELLYKSLSEVYCPYFGEKVIFNAKGLEHTKFKKKNHARSSKDQYMRFKLLYLAPEILKLSKTVQGITERKVFEVVRKNHRNEQSLVDAIYYEFIAVINKVRVRIVVREIGTAQKYFWSIIPYWKIDTNTGKRKLYSGNPEED